MYNMGSKSPEYSFSDGEPCKGDSCLCSRCTRTGKYRQFLSRLTLASKMVNYEEEISTVVAMILDVHIQFS